MAITQTEAAGPIRDKVTKDGRILHLLHFNFLPSILRFIKSQKMRQRHLTCIGEKKLNIDSV
jgi:hypothetical protein